MRPSPAVWVGRDVSGNDGDGDGDGGGGGDVSRRETVQPIADASSDDGVGGGGVSDHYSLVHAPHTPLLSSSPLSHSGSTGPSEEEHPRPIGNVEGDQGDRDDSDDGHRGDRRGEIRIQSMRARSWAPAKAAANEAAAAQASAETAAAAAAAAAADASAVASAAVAEDEAALLEEDSIVEALKEVRAALAAGREDEAGAQVERVAAGVGLAPALLGALKALRRRDMTASAPGAGGVGKAGEMAADVSASPNASTRSSPAHSQRFARGRNGIDGERRKTDPYRSITVNKRTPHSSLFGYSTRPFDLPLPSQSILRLLLLVRRL